MDMPKEVERLVRKYCGVIVSNIWLCTASHEMH